MKKKLFGLHLQLRALWRSIRQVNAVHLGTDVIYKGKICFVNNGVSAPMWDLCEKEWNVDGTRNTYRAHERDFKKILSLSNLDNGLFYLYRWYMLYWHEIELRKMMERKPEGDKSC